MDGNRFDALARGVAAPTTRRSALKGIAGGGFLAALGVRAAAPAEAAGTTCTLSVTANVRLGPDTGALLTPGASQAGQLQGTMSLPLGPDGAIDQGQLRLANGTTVAVVGQATGRSVQLRLTIAPNQTIILVGTAAQALTTCSGSVDGLLTGPQAGDLGDWHALASGLVGGTSTNAGTTPTTGQGSTSSTGGGAPEVATATQPAASTAQATQTQATQTSTGACASGVVCGGTCCVPRAGFTPNQISCDGTSCACTYSCQAAGCPNGGTAHSFSVGCDDRPDALCGENCNFPTDTGCGNVTCAPGTTLDLDTCTCAPAAGGGGCPSGQTNCGDIGCIDLQTDIHHCGTCNNDCGVGKTCTAGVCGG